MALAAFLLFATLVIGNILLAWRKGGGPERAVSWLYFAAWVISIATDTPRVHRYVQVEAVTALVDFALLIALAAIAAGANRRWPILAAGLQLVLVLVHISRWLVPATPALVYMLVTTFWPLIQLVILLVAILVRWKRGTTRGAERSWVSFSR